MLNFILEMEKHKIMKRFFGIVEADSTKKVASFKSTPLSTKTEFLNLYQKVLRYYLKN